MRRVHLIISGDVVGVSFRSWSRAQAQELGLVGWVRNREDDTVEIVAEGAKDKLEELVKRCSRGPDVAWVKKVDIEWQLPSNEFAYFDIVH